MVRFILRIQLFGAAHQVEIVPTAFNVATALCVVRMQGEGHTHDLAIHRDEKLLFIVEKEHIFDNLRPHLPTTPMVIEGKRFRSAVGLSPTNEMADWLIEISQNRTSP
jgi:hypothetical protein